MIERNELKNALLICWMVISILMLFTIFISFLVGDATILGFIPACTAVKNGGSCFMCGTTRVFVAISNFKLNEAYGLNKFGVLLYFIFIINSLLFLKKLTNLFNKKRFF